MKKTIEVLVCDLHRGYAEAASTVRMSWNGKSYQLDLCDEHRSEVDSAVRSWVGGSRPTKRVSRPASKTAPRRTRKATRAKRATGPNRATGPKRRTSKRASGSGSIAEVRKWAQSNGFDVKSRGRIPADVRAAYKAAKR